MILNINNAHSVDEMRKHSCKKTTLVELSAGQSSKQPCQGGATGTFSKQKAFGKYSVHSEALAAARLPDAPAVGD